MCRRCGSALYAGEKWEAGASSGNQAWGAESLMDKTSQSYCSCANEAGSAPSFLDEGSGVGAPHWWRIPLKFSLSVLSLAIFLGGCGGGAPQGLPPTGNQARGTFRARRNSVGGKGALGERIAGAGVWRPGEERETGISCGERRTKDAIQQSAGNDRDASRGGGKYRREMGGSPALR